MTLLNTKVDVLRGWMPGDSSSIEQSLPWGTSVSLVPGTVATINSSTQFVLPASSANPQALYFIVEGNQTSEFDTNFVTKALGIRGKLTVKTDQFVATSIAPGRLISFNTSGQFIDNGTTSSPGGGLTIGWCLENNNSVDGTITVEINL